MESLPEGPFALVASFLTLPELTRLDSTCCALRAACRDAVWQCQEEAHPGAKAIPVLQENYTARDRMLLWHKVNRYCIKKELKVLLVQQQAQEQREQRDGPTPTPRLTPSRVSHMASTDFRGYTAFFVRLFQIQDKQSPSLSSDSNEDAATVLSPLYADFAACTAPPLHGYATLGKMKDATLDWELLGQEDMIMDTFTPSNERPRRTGIYLTIVGVKVRGRGRRPIMDTIFSGEMLSQGSFWKKTDTFVLSLEDIILYQSHDLSICRQIQLQCRRHEAVVDVESITVSHVAQEMEQATMW